MSNNQNPVPEEWLRREDCRCYDDRLARLKWLDDNTPHTNLWLFPGGLVSKYLFEESRYCFVYGQFLATIVLGLSYIEHTLAGLFYASGRNDLERANISTLLKETMAAGWISQVELDDLRRFRKIRNSVTHFRRPLRDDTIEYRAVTQNECPYRITEKDARQIMKTVLHLLGRTRIGRISPSGNAENNR